MVVGNGLLAKAFNQYKDNDKVIIFASGVSNSKEINESEFEREKKLLNSFLNVNAKRLVYFSTCSILDESLRNSPYVKHKIYMEKYIRRNFPNNIIFRLPNIVGKTDNPNTFFNYFKSSILNEYKISIDKNATRYLIDVDDLVFFLPELIEKDLLKTTYSKTINIAMDNQAHVSEIVDMMGKILGKTISKRMLDTGSYYEIDNQIFLEYLKQYGISDFSEYNFKILKKYLS